MRFILIRSHHYDIPEALKIPEGIPLHVVAQRLQANLRKQGVPDGISYKAHDGDWVSAIVEARTI